MNPEYVPLEYPFAVTRIGADGTIYRWRYKTLEKAWAEFELVLQDEHDWVSLSECGQLIRWRQKPGTVIHGKPVQLWPYVPSEEEQG